VVGEGALGEAGALGDLAAEVDQDPRARRGGGAAFAARPASCLRPGWPRPSARHVLRGCR
jgi:hypothetical protein